MQLRDFLKVIQKRWWLVLLVGAAAALTALGYSLTQPRTFETTINILGTTAKPDEGLNNYIKGQVRRYSTLITSDTIAQKIDERGKFDLGYGAISGKIKPQALPDNYTLKVIVEDTDPRRAARIADTAADIIREDNLASMASVPEDGKVFFDKISAAPIPERPSTPRTGLNTGAGLALGLVVGLILIFFLEFFDTNLSTEEDITRNTGLKVIGSIPPWRGPRTPPGPKTNETIRKIFRKLKPEEKREF